MEEERDSSLKKLQVGHLKGRKVAPEGNYQSSIKILLERYQGEW